MKKELTPMTREQYLEQFGTEPNLSHVIQGIYEPTEKEREQLAELIGKGCREKNKREIKSVCMYGLTRVANWGIMSRVIFGDNRVFYIAGQSYPDEIRIVRQGFLNR
jgi:hypothetical protein